MTGVDIEDLAALELADERPAPTTSNSAGAIAISIPPSAIPTLDDSLFSATTPSNTIFLSTLADQFPPPMLSNNTPDHDSIHAGSTSSAIAPFPSTQRRGISSGSEDETDGTVEGGHSNNRKGKGREVVTNSSFTMKDSKGAVQETEGGGSVLL